MSSAVKTIALLSHFSATRPEIGLSEFCRLAGRDKATTHRHLQALEESGFVEQNPVTKAYRLGPVVLQLARTRELTMPRKAGAETVASRIAETTGETVHVSVLSGSTLYPLTSCESDKHSTRVIIDVQTFPLHATASGICALAFGPQELLKVACGDMHAFTRDTPTSPEVLERAVDAARQTGFARSDRGYEEDVSSISAPIFDQSGLFAGAVSVASVTSRFTPELQRRIQSELIAASREISRNWGGKVPENIESVWRLHTKIQEVKDVTS
ncbi:IclR family transcriptional regulator [Sedimentitalea sp. XS_ASV28]